MTARELPFTNYKLQITTYTAGMISLGLDIGTTTISAVAFDTANHKLLASSNVPTDADVTSPAQRALGWAEIDLYRVFDHALASLYQVVIQLGDRSESVPVIGMTGQMHGVAFLDEHMKPARTAITWQDQRGREVLPAFMARAGGAGAFEKMGALPAGGYGAVTLFWLHKHNALPTASPCTIPDAIGAMLCGAKPTIHVTHAAGWGTFDLVQGMWDNALLARLGMDVELPTVASAGAPIGQITRNVAARCGLPNGTPVSVALGDHQASLIGSGCTHAGMAHVNIGTGSQVSLISDLFLPMNAHAGVETRPFINNQFVVTGAALCGGSAFAVLRRFYEDAARMMKLPVPDEASLYAAMVASAAEIAAGVDGLIADPRFDGTRNHPQHRASLQGLTRNNFTPAHLNRAVLEGIADELAQFYEAMLIDHAPAKSLLGAGNALRKNALLREIVSRRFGLSLQMPAWQEEAAVGAAMLADL